jgi:hypothetical protein
MKPLVKRILAAIVAAALLGLSIFLSESAFNQVLDFRKLERIPASMIAESVGGESQLKGIATAPERLLTAPDSGTETIYYRYLKERQEKDSDGNTRWKTVDRDEQSSNFMLMDESGKAMVRAREYAWRIRWSVARKHRRRSGDYRYTEWRIDPGDRVTVFGLMSHSPEPVVEFADRGHYVPIVSSFSASSERSDIALTAVLWLWGGLSALIFASLLATYILRIHKTLFFLLIISLTGGLLLLQYGYRSTVSDVVDGYDRVVSHRERANELIVASLSGTGLGSINLDGPFDLNSVLFAELSDTDKARIEAWRSSAWKVRHRYLVQISRFPELVVAASRGMDHPPDVVVPVSLLGSLEAAEADFQITRTTASLLWVLLIVVAASGATWFAFRAINTKRMQENLPTSKTAGVVFGLAEVKGRLVAEDSDKLLAGPLSGMPCTWYHYVVEEKRGSGKNASWHVIEDKIGKQPFYCEDDEGRIRVFPGRAECITRHIEKERRGRKRYREERLAPDDDLYILGKARLDKTRGDSLVFSHDKSSPYLIANISEEAVMYRKAGTGFFLMSLTLSALFLGAMLLTGSEGQMSSVDFLLAALIAPLFMVLAVIVLMYNDLIFLKQRCDRNWANIQVSLKKRADLVPQLESVVKKYLAHESDLQQNLATLRERRRRVDTTADMDDYMALEHASIDGLNARVEQYPELEGIDLISVFNRRLIKLENEVALIRAGFNDAVTEYQTRCQSFPDNLLASIFGFKSVSLLSYTERAHHVPPLVRLEDAGQQNV